MENETLISCWLVENEKPFTDDGNGEDATIDVQIAALGGPMGVTDTET
jgi:hypothetical protein